MKMPDARRLVLMLAALAFTMMAFLEALGG
jgi:hypothetical protein